MHRAADWEGTLDFWPAMHPTMDSSQMLPCHITKKHLAGWPMERTKYFLDNLRMRHNEVLQEFLPVIQRMYEYFRSKRVSGWKPMSEKIRKWRNWWATLVNDWISGRLDVTKPLFHPSQTYRGPPRSPQTIRDPPPVTQRPAPPQKKKPVVVKPPKKTNKSAAQTLTFLPPGDPRVDWIHSYMRAEPGNRSFQEMDLDGIEIFPETIEHYVPLDVNTILDSKSPSAHADAVERAFQQIHFQFCFDIMTADRELRREAARRRSRITVAMQIERHRCVRQRWEQLVQDLQWAAFEVLANMSTTSYGGEAVRNPFLLNWMGYDQEERTRIKDFAKSVCGDAGKAAATERSMELEQEMERFIDEHPITISSDSEIEQETEESPEIAEAFRSTRDRSPTPMPAKDKGKEKAAETKKKQTSPPPVGPLKGFQIRDPPPTAAESTSSSSDSEVPPEGEGIFVPGAGWLTNEEIALNLQGTEGGTSRPNETEQIGDLELHDIPVEVRDEEGVEGRLGEAIVDEPSFQTATQSFATTERPAKGRREEGKSKQAVQKPTTGAPKRTTKLRTRSKIYVPQLIEVPAAEENRFRDGKAAARYQKFEGLQIVQDRGFDEADLAHNLIRGLIQRNKWQQFARHYIRPVSWELVREFFANMFEEEEQEGFTEVRGVRVDFRAQTINRLLGLDGVIFTRTGQEQRLGPKSAALIRIIEQTFCRNHQPIFRKGATFDETCLEPALMPFINFFFAQLHITSHVNEASGSMLGPLFGILSGDSINVGNVIMRNMLRRLCASRLILCYPALIWRLCEQAGVNMGEFERDFEMGDPIALPECPEPFNFQHYTPPETTEVSVAPPQKQTRPPRPPAKTSKRPKRSTQAQSKPPPSKKQRLAEQLTEIMLIEETAETPVQIPLEPERLIEDPAPSPPREPTPEPIPEPTAEPPPTQTRGPSDSTPTLAHFTQFTQSVMESMEQQRRETELIRKENLEFQQRLMEENRKEREESRTLQQQMLQMMAMMVAKMGPSQPTTTTAEPSTKPADSTTPRDSAEKGDKDKGAP